ncbi:MAG: trypsin-like peptidase domain-containing protein [Clostridia bacterium]|nr:trypsin-like peptidase domain-containing protein [Clostridia bacterium]
MKKSFCAGLLTLLLCLLLPLTAFAAELGDVDGNGRINSIDARIALRAAARLETLDYETAVRADADGNGKIGAADARIILRVAAKLQDAPTTEPEVTLPPPPTTEAPTTEIPTTEAPTTEAPTTEAPTTEAPTTDPPVTEPVTRVPADPDALTPKQIHKIASAYTVEISVEAHDDYYGDYTATGSGFYISEDGLLITNYHVIDCAKTVTVIHSDGTEHNVSVIEAYDKNVDLAILRVDDVQGITPAVICKEPVETGDVIYTLGSSLGLTGTFTQGIVSNASRVDKTFNASMTYIQFDAAITNGNSGGPLINDRGEVVGIIDWGYNEGQNLNFAIPVSYIDELVTNPVTVEEFAGGTEMNASSDPDAPRYTGIAATDGTRANVKPHTPASVVFTVCSTLDGAAIGDLPVNITGAPVNVTVRDSGWVYTLDGAGNIQPFIVIAMWADEPVPETKISISVEGAEYFCGEFLLTVSEEGSGNYLGFGDTPDFGNPAGISPDDFTMTETGRFLFEEYTDTVPPTFVYENVRLETANDYRRTLEEAGFTLYSSYDQSIGSTVYIYNAPGGNYQIGVTVTLKAFRGYTMRVQLTDFINPENPVIS